MKKVLFTFVATLAFGLFASANTIDVETEKTVKLEEKKEVEENSKKEVVKMEEVGPISDCVQHARNHTLMCANQMGWDYSSGSENYNLLMFMFRTSYSSCLEDIGYSVQ